MSEESQEQSKTLNTEFEAKQNLLGFFSLLLEIDMRNNPALYKKKFNENYDDNRSPNNAN